MRVVSDKDVIRDIRESKKLAVGLVGSDVTHESDVSGLEILPVANIAPLRFSVLCVENKLVDIRAKLKNKEPLLLGTSYPRALLKYLGATAETIVLRKGAIEGLPWRFPELDGVFELQKTGDSAVANGLVTALDVADVMLMQIMKQEGATYETVMLARR